MPQIPTQLLNSLKLTGSFDEHAFVEAHNPEHRITSIRLNPFKKTELDFNVDEPVKWCENSYYINSRPSFTYDPLFHAGCYYVQEAGSMFIEYVLKSTIDFTEKQVALDLCGAPGGKSTLINSLLNTDSLLVANEFTKTRAGILSMNLSKWGTSNTVVTNNDPEKFSAIKGFFDFMVVDAPCSGSGLFRKQPEAIEEWSAESVTACSLRQKKILESSLPALKENGLLIYSTCSYSGEENEDIVSWLIEHHEMEFVKLEVDPSWKIVETALGYRFYPHLAASEGFFCAVLRKKKEEQSLNLKKVKPQPAAPSAIYKFMKEGSGEVLMRNNQYHVMNSASADFLVNFEKMFYFKKAGTVAGELKGKDFVPNQELAWWVHLGREVTKIELPVEDALKFLKKEQFNINGGAMGLALFTYKGFGLGWGKMLGNRINNYLPNELRIIK